MHDLPPLARFGTRVATGLRDVTADPAALDSTGFWAVVADFEGRLTCARFDDVRQEPVPAPGPGRWRGPAAGDWSSSLDRAAYTAGVRRIREHIAAGGPALIDAAHWATERPWLDDAAAVVRSATGLTTLISDLDTDPWTIRAGSGSPIQ